MSIDSYGAKLTKRDVTELAQASEQLVVVADMIRLSGVKWAEVAVNLLIVVNNTVVRIQTKGAAAFARRNLPVLVQRPDTCIVGGMPGAAIEAGVASESLTLEEIARRLRQWTPRSPPNREMANPR